MSVADVCPTVSRTTSEDAVGLSVAEFGRHPPTKSVDSLRQRVRSFFAHGLLRVGFVAEALDLCHESDQAPTSGDLIAVGDRCRREGLIGAALRAYQEAGCREKLLATAAACLRLGRLDEGLRAFRAVEVDPDPRQLIDCGEMCIEQAQYADACRAFRIAGARDRLLSIGRAWRDADEPGRAILAFKAADDRRELIDCALKCLAKGLLADAMNACQSAGATISAESLVACGDRCAHAGDLGTAFVAYKCAGARERLISLGAEFLRAGRRDEATEAYCTAAALE